MLSKPLDDHSKAVDNAKNVVIFRDAKLQKHFDRVVSVVQNCPPGELPILALLDAWYWFRLTEGDESPRVNEAIEHLLSPEQRQGLRSWYRRLGDKTNPTATEFRDRLSKMAGESFGSDQ